MKTSVTPLPTFVAPPYKRATSPGPSWVLLLLACGAVACAQESPRRDTTPISQGGQGGQTRPDGGRAGSGGAGGIAGQGGAGSGGVAGSGGAPDAAQAPDAQATPPDAGSSNVDGRPPTGGGAPISVLTNRYDNGRTGWNAQEKSLTPANVRAQTFGKLFVRKVDGQIYAQPLIVAGLEIGGKKRNVLYVVTMKNNAYAFDADVASEATPLWMAKLGPTVPKQDVCGCNDVQPEIGATATPVIDPATKTIWFTTKHLENGRYSYKLQALDIVTGMPKPGSPVEIAGEVPGTATSAVNGKVKFDARRHLNRPGLLLQNGTIYIGFGSHGDTPPYHGWIAAVDATTMKQTALFNTTPGASHAAVWMGGGGLVGDGQHIYFATGNGRGTNPATNPPALGNSFIKLDKDLKLVDWLMRSGYTMLDGVDADWGTSGPLLIPGTNYMVMSGKDRVALVYDKNKLGAKADDALAVQKFSGLGANRLGGANYGGWIFWQNGPSGSVAYTWHSQSRLLGFKWTGEKFDETPVFVGPDMLGMVFTYGFLAGSSDAGKNGVIFAYTTDGANPNQRIVAGRVRAYDAVTAAKIWDTNEMKTRDDPGLYATMAMPTVANGKLYLPTWTGSQPGVSGVGVSLGELVVYGLLP